jgi:hypothetical protein
MIQAPQMRILMAVGRCLLRLFIRFLQSPKDSHKNIGV